MSTSPTLQYAAGAAGVGIGVAVGAEVGVDDGVVAAEGATVGDVVADGDEIATVGTGEALSEGTLSRGAHAPIASVVKKSAVSRARR